MTLFSYVEGKFDEGDTAALMERFDKIENQLEEVKGMIADVKNTIYERGVSGHFEEFCNTKLQTNFQTRLIITQRN